MQYFSLQSACNNLILSQPGGPDHLGAVPGGKPVLMPADSELEQYVYLRGVTVGNIHAYEIIFFGGVPGYVADIPASSQYEGAPVQFWQANNGTNQLWTFLPHQAQPLFQIMNVNSGLVLDVPAFSQKPGTNIQQWIRNTNYPSNQSWSLIGKGLNAGPPDFVLIKDQNNQKDPAGFYILASGTGFSPHTLYSVWFMNVPAAPVTSAWQDTQGDYISGNPLLTLQSDNNGLIADYGFIAYKNLNYNGFAVCVLEDPQGYVTAFAVV